MNKTILTTSIVALSVLGALSSCTSNATDPYTTRELAWNSFTLVSVPAQQVEPAYVVKSQTAPVVAHTKVMPAKTQVVMINKSTQTAPVMVAPVTPKKEIVPIMPGRGRSMRSY